MKNCPRSVGEYLEFIKNSVKNPHYEVNELESLDRFILSSRIESTLICCAASQRSVKK